MLARGEVGTIRKQWDFFFFFHVHHGRHSFLELLNKRPFQIVNQERASDQSFNIRCPTLWLHIVTSMALNKNRMKGNVVMRSGIGFPCRWWFGTRLFQPCMYQWTLIRVFVMGIFSWCNRTANILSFCLTTQGPFAQTGHKPKLIANHQQHHWSPKLKLTCTSTSIYTCTWIHTHADAIMQ